MIELSTDGGKSYTKIELDDVDTDDAIALEDGFGITWLAFLRGLNEGSAKAQKALVWLARRRDEPGLTPADVHYELAKFAVRGDDVPPLGEDSARNDTSTS